MPSEQIGQYEIEYCGVHLIEHEGWGAHVTIIGPSTNPMHRNVLFPDQRVEVEHVFDSEQEAEAAARAAALHMIEHGTHRHRSA